MGRADRALLARKVVLLRRQDMSKRAIAHVLGISCTTVGRMLAKQETVLAAERHALPTPAIEARRAPGQGAMSNERELTDGQS